MEKNRISCKICNRRFSNGKAMGGHMRSHLAKLPLPPKPQQQQQLHHQYPNSLSSSSSSLHFPPSPNPFQSYRSVNHDLPFISKADGGGGGGGDGESETESSPRSTTRRRSKRRRKSVEKVAESQLVVKVLESSAEQVSSVSDEIFSDEDVALCLLMLSKDHKRFKNNQNQKLKKKVVCDEYFIGETDWLGDEMAEDEEEEEEEDEDESFGEMPVRSIKSNGKYRCETCKKVFRSYQALGGHKASHKKIRKDDDYDGIGIRSGSGGASSSASVFVDQRIYKCPFCDKVFDSGQALGGHKKVHFSYLGNNVVNKPIPKSKSGDNLLDLNLPAPEEEDEEEDVDDELELSQVHQQRNW